MRALRLARSRGAPNDSRYISNACIAAHDVLSHAKLHHARRCCVPNVMGAEVIIPTHVLHHTTGCNRNGKFALDLRSRLPR